MSLAPACRHVMLIGSQFTHTQNPLHTMYYIMCVVCTGGVRTVPPDANLTRQMVNPRAVRRHNDPMDLVELARSVQNADKFVRATTSGKLQVIVDTIRSLQEQVDTPRPPPTHTHTHTIIHSLTQARQILETAKRDTQLHHAACNFTKVPGKTYHLYERSDGSTYFSMLSPRDWGSSCPHQFLGSYRLEHDQSWTPEEQIDERSRDITAIDRAIHSHSAIGYIQ